MPIIQHLITTYKLWHESLPHFPKASRYALGTKIDSLFLDTIEGVVAASFLSKEQKSPYIRKATVKLDLLKFFFQVAWEIKALDNKKYILISEKLDDMGRMLGGWLRQITK